MSGTDDVDVSAEVKAMWAASMEKIERQVAGERWQEVTVKLTYFDAGGIFYSGAERTWRCELMGSGESVSMTGVFADVAEMIERHALPGIGRAVGPVLVTCEEGYPRLFNVPRPADAPT